MSLKHHGKLSRRGQETVRFGLTRVCLRERPEQWDLTMLVACHGAQQPLVLVSTDATRGRRQGERLIHAENIKKWGDLSIRVVSAYLYLRYICQKTKKPH